MVDKKALNEQLRKLKQKIQEDPQVRALYDLDNDGRISGEEWDKARQEVIRFMEIQEARQTPEPAAETSGAGLAASAGLAAVGGAADHVFQQLKGGADQPAGAAPASGNLLDVPEIVIKQQVEGLELMTDFEGRNRYQFETPQGRALASAEESDTGMMGAITRNMFTSRRPFTMGISVLNTAEIIWLKRRFEWIFSRIEVSDDNNQPVGTIQQKFGLLHRKYRLAAYTSDRTLYIQGPIFKPWTFYVSDGDRQVALITKKWSGLFKEAFSRADSFGVKFEDDKLNTAERMMILGAAIAIDIDYFEQSQN